MQDITASDVPGQFPLAMLTHTSTQHVQDIAASDVPGQFPLALLPVGKSNDVSRVSGWGPVYKANWLEGTTVPDLLSAIAVAPEVNVDYWRVRLATADKALLSGTPFGSVKTEVRAALCRAACAWPPRLENGCLAYC